MAKINKSSEHSLTQDLLKDLNEEVIARKESEETLRKSEEKFYALFEKAPLGYQSLDENGIFVELNEAWLFTMGYNKDEVIGKWFGDFLAPEFVEAFRERFPIFKAKGSIHSEFEMIRKDGERRFIAFDGRIGYKADGSFKQTHCILQDNTDRRKAEEELKKTEHKYQTLFNEMMDGFALHEIICNDKGHPIDYRFLAVNPAFEKMTGLKAEQVIGKRILEIMPETEPYWIEKYGKVALKGESLSFENEAKYLGKIFDVKAFRSAPNEFVSIFNDITERRKLEEKERNSEIRYRRLFESAKDGILIIDAETAQIMDVNPFLENLLGYSHDSFIGMKIWELGPFKDTLESKIPFDILRREEYIRYDDLPLIASDGSIISVEFISNVYLVDKKRVIQCNIRNISDRKLALRELNKSEEKYRSIFENVQDVYYESSFEGEIIDVSPSIKFMSKGQISREDLIGKSILEIYSNIKDRENLISLLLKDGRVNDFEISLLNRDGTSIPCSLSSKLTFDSNGVPEKIIGSLHDISIRKQAEKRVKLLAHSLESVSECVSITDNNDVLIYVNEALLRTYGYSENELIGKHIKILRPNDFEQDSFRDIRLKTQAEGWRGELINIRKDGTIFPVLLSTSIIKDDNNEQIAIIGVSIDITEIRKNTEELVAAKERAEESDRLKTAFLHNISHEIRTPMNSIVGFSDLLNDPDTLPEERKHYTEIIIQNSNQLLSIISDIVNIATIEAGQEKSIATPVNLNSICNLVYEQFILKARNQNIALLFNNYLPDDEVYILTDGTKLTQILTNLINNAFKFTEKGHIELGYSLEGKLIKFFVTDTGVGIPPEKNEEIFKRFSQLSFARNHKSGGSGLGLSISKAYVELLGGKIWLHSIPGEGTTFYFTIPLVKN